MTIERKEIEKLATLSRLADGKGGGGKTGCPKKKSPIKRKPTPIFSMTSFLPLSAYTPTLHTGLPHPCLVGVTRSLRTVVMLTIGGYGMTGIRLILFGLEYLDL